MDKLYQSKVFWVIVGIITGIVATYTIMNFSTREMAPGDFRQNDDLDGVLIASASEFLNISSHDRFLYEPKEQFPVNERFGIQMDHQDPGMLITDFPQEERTGTINL